MAIKNCQYKWQIKSSSYNYLIFLIQDLSHSAQGWIYMRNFPARISVLIYARTSLKSVLHNRHSEITRNAEVYLAYTSTRSLVADQFLLCGVDVYATRPKRL